MNKLKKDIEEILAKTENSKDFRSQKEHINRFRYLRNLISNYEFRKVFILLIVGILLLTLLFGPFSHSSGYFLFFTVIIVLGFLFFLKKSNVGYEKKWRGKSIESDDTDAFLAKFKNFFHK